MARLGKGDQDKLRDAQRAWVAFRDKQCAFETASYSTGSIYPLLVTNCLAELTQQRTQTFDHYLDCPSGDTSCVPLTEAAAQSAPATTRHAHRRCSRQRSMPADRRRGQGAAICAAMHRGVAGDPSALQCAECMRPHDR